MRAKTSPCNARRRGFTLVEMIVATILLAVGVFGALGAFSAALQATTASNRIHTAALLAQRRLTEIELQPDAIAGGDQQGDFGEEYPGFRWLESVEPTDYPDLFKITLRVQWGSPPTPHERMVTTYLSRPAQSAQGASGQTSGANGTGANGTGANGGGAGNGRP